MNRDVADAFYFVARLNRHDQHHGRVVEYSRHFPAGLVTKEWVLWEVAANLGPLPSYKRGRPRPRALPVPQGVSPIGRLRIHRSVLRRSLRNVLPPTRWTGGRGRPRSGPLHGPG